MGLSQGVTQQSLFYSVEHSRQRNVISHGAVHLYQSRWWESRASVVLLNIAVTGEASRLTSKIRH